ncbi:MAG: tryptophan synthase subunit alpha [Candidatus Omnitrophica bacterium]|nr:tryptophan synthase subunit alpha [Candidatus Omnitrophota bacterium]
MNLIEKKFRDLRQRNKKAFIVYIAAGDPDLATTKRLILELDKCGVDIIELGIPFSDPMADGPTIQAASNRALKSGTTVRAIFAMAGSLAGTIRAALCVMTYYNPVFVHGLQRFVKDAKHAGIDGIIVPDLPCDESGDLVRLGRRFNFSVIQLCAPTTSSGRLEKIARLSTGFIYYVSLTGVTGARASLSADIDKNVRRIKKITAKPVCVGFGVSNPKQAKDIVRYADGVIVGSAVIRIIEKNLGKAGLVKNVGRFASRLRRAI